MTQEESTEIYIGDNIERAIEVIGEATDGVDAYQLMRDYADRKLSPDVELHGNYLYVTVDVDRND